MRNRQPPPAWEPVSGPMADQMVFGVIEWGAVVDVAPSVFMGSRAAVESHIAWEIREMGADLPELFADAPDFLETHPFPDSDTPAALHAWLCALHEATTVPWVSLYRVDNDAGVLRGTDADVVFEPPEED